jgi:hypothetical protein
MAPRLSGCRPWPDHKRVASSRYRNRFRAPRPSPARPVPPAVPRSAGATMSCRATTEKYARCKCPKPSPPESPRFMRLASPGGKPALTLRPCASSPCSPSPLLWPPAAVTSLPPRPRQVNHKSRPRPSPTWTPQWPRPARKPRLLRPIPRQPTDPTSTTMKKGAAAFAAAPHSRERQSGGT